MHLRWSSDETVFYGSGNMRTVRSYIIKYCKKLFRTNSKFNRFSSLRHCGFTWPSLQRSRAKILITFWPNFFTLLRDLIKPTIQKIQFPPQFYFTHRWYLKPLHEILKPFENDDWKLLSSYVRIWSCSLVFYNCCIRFRKWSTSTRKPHQLSTTS